MSYWFLSFLWRRNNETSWVPGEASITGEHPIGYIRRLRVHNPQTSFKLLFFTEIPAEIYELTRG